jgi:serine carboxypeptidase 1
VDVRPGAHMFWWLYGSTATTPRASTPIILWLQGGPGGSSTGIGNFGEFGPLDERLNPRNSTWLQAASLLFLDQPVGTGYSYVDDKSLLTKNNTEIAADVVSLLKAFLTVYPQLQETPFFIFCESYGGKMTTDIALALLAAKDSGAININLRAVALGDSWISGLSYVQAWGPYLQALSLFDQSDITALNDGAVTPCEQAVANGDWAGAIKSWGDAENIIETRADNVNFYNALLQNDNVEVSGVRHSRRHVMSDAALALAARGVPHETLRALFDRHVASRVSTPLDDLMNGPIKTKLNSGPNGVIIPAANAWFVALHHSVVCSTCRSGELLTPLCSSSPAPTGAFSRATFSERSRTTLCAPSWTASTASSRAGASTSRSTPASSTSSAARAARTCGCGS